MSAGGSVGMILDRALTPELLDVALRVATEHHDAPDARQLLSVALRDYVTPQEAANKTKKILTRVWVVPPEPAQAMIRWAIDNQGEFTDRRALHFGALLATYPFFGSIASTVGRQIHLDGAVDRRTIRTFARSTFGERAFVDAGASKSLATLRNLGVLDGARDGPYRIEASLFVPASFSAWFLHALILTRQAESVGTDELSRAHELAALNLAPASGSYALLELHAENGRSVAVAKQTDAVARPSRAVVGEPTSQPQLEFGLADRADGIHERSVR